MTVHFKDETPGHAPAPEPSSVPSPAPEHRVTHRHFLKAIAATAGLAALAAVESPKIAEAALTTDGGPGGYDLASNSLVVEDATATQGTIYLGSAENASIKFDGTNLVLMPASGNVGIGTTSPTTPLQVYKVDDSSNDTAYLLSLFRQILTGAPNRGTGLEFRDGNSIQAGIVGIREDDRSTYTSDLAFLTNNNNGSLVESTALTERMRILGDGNVGIGTSSPTSALTLAGSLKVTNNNPLGGSDNALEIGYDPTGTPYAYLQASTINVANRSVVFGGYDLRFATIPGGDISSLNGGNERMRITSTGNVGIGTISPVVKLDINGAAPSMHLLDPGTAEGGVGFQTGDSTLYLTNDYGLGNVLGYAPRSVALTNAGNVGIGTASPAQKLDVNGGIAASGTLVADGNGCYYA